MNTFIVYELVEYKDNMYDIRVEQLPNKIIITNVYEYNTDNDITEHLTREEISILTEILNFDLGYI